MTNGRLPPQSHPAAASPGSLPIRPPVPLPADNIIPFPTSGSADVSAGELLPGPKHGRVPSPSMQAQLLEEASKVVPDTQKLINMVSKRVRQLTRGHSPLVDPGPRIVFSDIALREIIEGKLTMREGVVVELNGEKSPDAKAS